MEKSKIGTEPQLVSNEVSRSKGVLKLFSRYQLVDTESKQSDPIACESYRRFLLLLFIDSTGAPTTIQFIVQFLNENDNLWYDYKQGLFAALFYEDGDTASGLAQCFSGDCMGRMMRLKIVGVGTTAIAYFTVGANVVLMN